MLDVLLEYPIASDRAAFSIQPDARAPGRARRHGAALPAARPARNAPSSSPAIPGLVRLDPRWHQAAWRFVKLGFAHILDGTDHLLFLFCLVIPFRRFRAAGPDRHGLHGRALDHLIASASGLAPDALWFPPLVETLIAASILYMALENIVGATNVQRRWVHGVRASAWCTASGSRSRCARRCSSPARTADVAAGLQRRRRARPAVRAGAARAGAAAAVPVRGRPSGWARSSCRRSSRIPRGTGRRSAGSAAAVRLARDGPAVVDCLLVDARRSCIAGLSSWARWNDGYWR